MNSNAVVSGWTCGGHVVRFFTECPRFFVAVACACALVQSMVIGGLVNVNISTLQQRFGWSSSTAGMLPSIYDLCGLPVAIFVGYLGNNANKPRCISIGMLIVAIGAIMHTFAHFLSTDYKPLQNGTDVNLICRSSANFEDLQCHSNNDNSYLGMFVMSMVVMGIGSVPLFTQTLTYFDDIASRETAAMYSGVFFSFSIIGCTLGYVFGGIMLTFNTDFEKGVESLVDVDDSRFVGAWWFMFLVAAAMAVVCAIPMYNFPKEMKGCQQIKENRKNEVHANSEKETRYIKSNMSSWKTTACIIKSLLYNGSFVGNTLSSVAEMSIIIGLSIFGAKYAENQFSISRTSAGLLLGIIAIPGGIGGSMFGSFLINKMEISCKRLLKYQFIGTLFCLLPAVMFLLRCEQSQFIGINANVKYQRGDEIATHHLVYDCNVNCKCGSLNYEPVCGADGNTYLSACYAGCQAISDDKKEFLNCRCVANFLNSSVSNENSYLSSSPSPTTSTDAVSRKGMCKQDDCNIFWLYAMVNLIAIFFIYTIGMFHYSILLRVVPEAQRDIAIGMDIVVTRLLGTVPAPLLFGTVIDTTCLLWSKECNAQHGACLYYDTTYIAWYLLTICSSYQLMACLASFFSWQLYRVDAMEQYSSGLQLEQDAKLDYVVAEVNHAFHED